MYTTREKSHIPLNLKNTYFSWTFAKKCLHVKLYKHINLELFSLQVWTVLSKVARYIIFLFLGSPGYLISGILPLKVKYFLSMPFYISFRGFPSFTDKWKDALTTNQILCSDLFFFESWFDWGSLNNRQTNKAMV